MSLLEAEERDRSGVEGSHCRKDQLSRRYYMHLLTIPLAPKQVDMMQHVDFERRMKMSAGQDRYWEWVSAVSER